MGAAFQPRLSWLESRFHSEIEVDKKSRPKIFPLIRDEPISNIDFQILNFTRPEGGNRVSRTL